MKRFKSFVNLFEAKKKDVFSMHPHVERFNLPDKHITKYGMHLGKITDESHDPEKVKTTVQDFDENQNSLPREKRDFTNYSSIDEINDALKPIKDKKAAKADIQTLEKVGKWEIRKVGSKEACIKNYGGQKTNWCVAAGGESNKFDSYSKSGKNKMYTIHNTENPEEYYAYHEGEQGLLQRRNQDKGSIDPDIFMKDKPELKNSKVLNNSRWRFRFNPTDENIHKALNDEDYYVRRSAAGNPNATPEHIDKAFNDSNGSVRAAAAENKNANPEHIDRALDDEDSFVRSSAMRNPNATPGHIDRALNDKNWMVRGAAINNPNATPENIHKALNDENEGVRKRAIDNPNATPEHIDKAFNDSNGSVRAAAAKNLNATSENIHKALNDENFLVRRSAAGNPNATPEHIDKAFNDKNWMVREAAINNPNATYENLIKALNSPDDEVRRIARKKLEKFNTIKESNEPIDLSKKREEKNLQKFHSKMRSDISDRVSSMREAINKHREAGRLPMSVGDRFTTEQSRRNNFPPSKVVGYYVDPKNPEGRYGYHVERGDGEKSMHMIRDPKLEKLHGKEKWNELQSGVRKLGGLKSIE